MQLPETTIANQSFLKTEFRNASQVDVFSVVFSSEVFSEVFSIGERGSADHSSPVILGIILRDFLVDILRGHANAHFSGFSFAQISRAAFGGSHPTDSGEPPDWRVAQRSSTESYGQSA
jgi:hypothetical protein